MGNYAITATSVRASANAKRFQLNPASILKGDPLQPTPNPTMAGAAITAGQPVYQGTDDLFYPADASPIAAQTSGSLVVGRRYIITTFVAGDNFTNVGAASNASGVIFVATGTTPTTWSNLSILNDADAVYKAVGIAENSAGVGQPISVVTDDPMFTPGCTVAVGDVGVVSADRGAIAPHTDIAAGMYVAVLWNAWSTTQVQLKINRSDAVRI